MIRERSLRDRSVESLISMVDFSRLDNTVKGMIIRELRIQISEKVSRNKADIISCPRCGSEDGVFNTFHDRNDFCGNCGQALDWEDGE